MDTSQDIVGEYMMPSIVCIILVIILTVEKATVVHYCLVVTLQLVLMLVTTKAS